MGKLEKEGVVGPVPSWWSPRRARLPLRALCGWLLWSFFRALLVLVALRLLLVVLVRRLRFLVRRLLLAARWCLWSSKMNLRVGESVYTARPSVIGWN